MKVFSSIEACQNIQNPVLTLGMYDGVHKGHQKIIQQLNTIAKEVNGESVLMSFDPHPRLVLQPDFDLELISTLSEKKEILAQNDLHNFVIQSFTREFSQVSARDFVVDYLIGKINVHTLVIGYDHHFGKNREGNFEQLTELSKEYGFNVVRINEICEGETPISSTKIRKALKTGDIEYANNALGYNFTLTGEVIHGDKLGRTLGFPTANLKLPAYKLVPKTGVYVVHVQIEGKLHLGLLSIGYRETVTDNSELRVEVNILDFEGDLYGKILSVEIMGFIRNEKKFNSLEELTEAMNHDKEYAINNFSV
ncbi:MULTISPECIES: bifunctional riboflavin kinase/FAD synthetase [Weeksella]|uniref:Riboflavin biosynthesis protein n=1 Tax=Weeksella virosa (strain ATCC 43766 / DSM 16922 / JCM 21250 / CCUG 30538 / CDC 9751 / IAM 14551 / NBRC 16016 / NCTC 11634 / CL345/78) TaxID=865938 RepID=F0P190_WEEVC|nr:MULTISPECIES: bifunctional riboflavin kinase/FAD synthetase [Weeksella]ADX67589.1 riboflavin biosynthesis protein RibF [Weeksella virosa DSM 16922]OFM82948.1 riboflavin biosynthesis protein RibF [Weeksella sp. HMSC059D05]VEH64787.1 Riboflavin biosynthesis protein ribF [Weeksella virosa]